MRPVKCLGASGTRGEYWRTYWEPASLYQLRQGVAAQAKITDGAIGCCRVRHHRRIAQLGIHGYTPSNPASGARGMTARPLGLYVLRQR